MWTQVEHFKQNRKGFDEKARAMTERHANSMCAYCKVFTCMRLVG
jgi:hypothetical protein